MPLYAFIDDCLVWSELRPSDIDGARGTEAALLEILGQIWMQWPGIEIIIRGDGGFCREALAGTEMARCQCGTIRLRLLKIGVRVKVSVRRVSLSLSESCPYQEVFAQAWRNLSRLSRVASFSPARC